MGIGFSKKEKKINLPNDYKLIKIVSYNVRLIFSSPLRANKIGFFLSRAHDNIDNDIICLQGIYDDESRNIIIDIFKNDYPNIYIIPESESSVKNLEKYQSPVSISNRRIKKNEEYGCKNVGIMILSKYEVLDYKCKKFKEIGNSTTEHTGIVCININIDNNIISIYNTQMQSDYKDIISNVDIRKIQLKQITSFIKSNIDHIHKNPYFKIYKNTDVNLIMGSFNIQGKNMNEKYLTNEYLDLINDNYFDIYKTINEDINHIFENRKDYILLYLLDELDMNHDTNELDDIMRVKKMVELSKNKSKNILNKIFKFYKINFIKISMHDIDFSDHYPIELIVILKTR